MFIRKTIRELQSLGMSNKKIARILFGDAEEFNVIKVDVLGVTAIQAFYEELFKYQEEFEARAFLAKCRPLI